MSHPRHAVYVFRTGSLDQLTLQRHRVLTHKCVHILMVVLVGQIKNAYILAQRGRSEASVGRRAGAGERLSARTFEFAENHAFARKGGFLRSTTIALTTTVLVNLRAAKQQYILLRLRKTHATLRVSGAYSCHFHYPLRLTFLSTEHTTCKSAAGCHQCVHNLAVTTTGAKQHITSSQARTSGSAILCRT
jgi:hypothetical protein